MARLGEPCFIFIPVDISNSFLITSRLSFGSSYFSVKIPYSLPDSCRCSRTADADNGSTAAPVSSAHMPILPWATPVFSFDLLGSAEKLGARTLPLRCSTAATPPSTEVAAGLCDFAVGLLPASTVSGTFLFPSPGCVSCGALSMWGFLSPSCVAQHTISRTLCSVAIAELCETGPIPLSRFSSVPSALPSVSLPPVSALLPMLWGSGVWVPEGLGSTGLAVA
mmetsp:Transcript_32585/g.58332  ORF Transcript_32585/g.58332 Transcript_32585/m.58332 type:complete len:223 (-) Transcript_32585:2294-2962(-)